MPVASSFDIVLTSVPPAPVDSSPTASPKHASLTCFVEVINKIEDFKNFSSSQFGSDDYDHSLMLNNTKRTGKQQG